MKLIRYTLNEDGTLPDYVIDGGYFPKFNDGPSPQDYDLIGISETNPGLEEYTTKVSFENYVKSFTNESYLMIFLNDNTVYYTQDDINSLWDRANE
tara:strand:+ start:225 stop:512 length:288 start_codon:yes stop_codon:yes gene_type:complete